MNKSDIRIAREPRSAEVAVLCNWALSWTGQTFHQLFRKENFLPIVTVGIELAKNVFAMHVVELQATPCWFSPSLPRSKQLLRLALKPAGETAS